MGEELIATALEFRQRKDSHTHVNLNFLIVHLTFMCSNITTTSSNVSQEIVSSTAIF